MNKLYVTAILFLALPICAMEHGQPKARVFSFYHGGHVQDALPEASFIGQYVKPDILNQMTDEQKKDWYFNFLLEDWKSASFIRDEGVTDMYERSGWTKEAQDAWEKRNKEILRSAENYEAALFFSKIFAANYVSYVTIDPIFQAIANRMPAVAKKSPVTVRDFSVPAASFLLGFGIEGRDLALGHALFNKNISRRLQHEDYVKYSQCKITSEIMFRMSLQEGIKDFKAATMVSILRIVADQGMRLIGVYDELDKLKTSSKSLQEICNIISYVGRPVAQIIIADTFFGDNMDYKKYLNQPNCPS